MLSIYAANVVYKYICIFIGYTVNARLSTTFQGTENKVENF